MGKQRKHTRISKKGKKFRAGKRKISHRLSKLRELDSEVNRITKILGISPAAAGEEVPDKLAFVKGAKFALGEGGERARIVELKRFINKISNQINKIKGVIDPDLLAERDFTLSKLKRLSPKEFDKISKKIEQDLLGDLI